MKYFFKLIISLGLLLGVSRRVFAQVGEVVIGAALVGGGLYACPKSPDTSSMNNTKAIAVDSASAQSSPIPPATSTSDPSAK